MLKMVLADKQAIFRAGIAKVLGVEDEIRIVAQVHAGEQIVPTLEKFRPNVLAFATNLVSDLPQVVQTAVDSKTRAEVMQITDIFRAKIVDVQPKSLTIEVTGDESKVEKLLNLLKTFGIIELTRTGKVALPRK